jgi:hypothetical protein
MAFHATYPAGASRHHFGQLELLPGFSPTLVSARKNKQRITYASNPESYLRPFQGKQIEDKTGEIVSGRFNSRTRLQLWVKY